MTRNQDDAGPRLECAEFRADGNCPPLALAVLYLGMVVAGVPLGWLIRELTHFIGCCGQCILGPASLAVLGVVLGGVGYALVRWGRIASPAAAGWAGVVGVAAASVGQLLNDYWHAPVQVGFVEYVASREPVLYIGLVVSFLLGSAACFGLIAAAASDPFCRACQQWHDKVALGRPDLYKAELVEAVAAGRLLELAAVDTDAGLARAELLAHVCPRCRAEGTIVLEVRDKIVDQKKNETTEQVLGRWTYGGEVWPVIDRLFPGRLPPEVEL